jgi:hypothetical protein
MDEHKSKKISDSVPPKSASQARTTPKSRLTELVTLVVGTARTKGWSADVDASDNKNYRYATVSVSRTSGSNTVTGVFEIICDQKISISHHNTSFHGRGLSDLNDAIGNELAKIEWIEKKPPAKPKPYPEISVVERVLRRFHAFARQLRHRYADRSGIEVKDEYDVQDLVHALLRGLFDDIRAEEYTPSYAGGSSRIDFLLKAPKIAVEIKIASAALRDKQIGEQLLIDIGRYQAHPDCRQLVCFVYDPGGNLKNPAGLETDLSKTIGDLEVKLIVVSV